MRKRVTNSSHKNQLNNQNALPGPATAVVMDHAQENLYVGTRTGHLVRFDLEEPAEPRFVEAPSAGPAPISALGLLIGDQSLVVGDARGGVRVWFQVARESYACTPPLRVR